MEMEEPDIRGSRGREEYLLTQLVDTARGVREITTWGEDPQAGRAGKRRRTSQGEGGRERATEFEGGAERGREVDEGQEGDEEAEAGIGGRNGRTPSPLGRTREDGGRREGGRERGREREVQRRVLGLLRELSEVHRERVSLWREALEVTARTLYHHPPLEGERLEQTCHTDGPIQGRLRSDVLGDTLRSVEGDARVIDARLANIRATLDVAMSTLATDEGQRTTKANTEVETNALKQGTSQSQPFSSDTSPLNTKNASESHDTPGFVSDQLKLVLASDVVPCGQEAAGDTHDASHVHSSSDSQGVSVLNPSRPPAGLGGVGETEAQVDTEGKSTEAENKVEIEDSVVCAGEQGAAIHAHDPLETARNGERGMEGETQEEGKPARGSGSKLVTLGLTGKSTNGQADVPDACYVTAPSSVAEVVTCEVADALSSSLVTGSEELVSRVLRVKVRDGTRCRFPVTVAVPFRARYRGNYRDVVVKVVDGEGRASYIRPLVTEGRAGGKRGSCAQVRVYALGLFAVLSCLKRESYTVPRRGLSIKLSMEPRVCLDYLPGSFTAPVVVQATVQPVDATLLASLRSRSDVYHSVVSTTPLLHLAQPASLPLRRPLALTLPCPPNPDKRRQGEEPDRHTPRPVSAAPPQDTASLSRGRALSATVQSSREPSNELLALLGWREEQWNVLEKIPVRSLQNGLVSFQLTENYERLIVARLLSSVRPSHLVSLVGEVEASVRRTMVSVVLQRHRDDPQAAVVAVLPSRDLSWELSKLRAQAYCGPPEPSQEIPMSEGEQLLLSFSGNITSTGHRNAREPITFHSQRKNRLFLRLTEVDPFGNYSSPHYKGTAVFHKVARGHPGWRGEEAVPSSSRPLGEPVCKLSLTLPKKVRSISRPVSAKVKLCDETDSLSDPVLRWLSQELSEGDVASLVLSLRLRRSAIQLTRLQAPDSLPAQAFHILGVWRRSLPAAPEPSRASQLARCLARSGRPDLAKELLLRQAATRGRSGGAVGEVM